MSSDFHRKQARSFGQRLLRQLRRIANYGAPHTAVRVTLHTIDGGELIGHVDLDSATADILTDLAKTQADTWDRETGVTGEPSNDDWNDQTFQRMYPELACELAKVAAHVGNGESIDSGEWSAAAVAQNDNRLYREIDRIFNKIDPQAYLDDVFSAPNPDESLTAYEQLVTGEWDGEL